MAKILIAEDMSIIREPIAMALERAGHEVLQASNGKEALAFLRGQLADLILLDIQMPEMTGIEALRKIRAEENLRDLPVILLTSKNDRETVLQAATLGVRHYLLKSVFSVDELLLRVNAALATEDVEASTSSTPTPIACNGNNAHANSTEGTESDSTEVLPNQSFDPEEALKERKPLLNRSELAERLDACGELKGMSPTVSEVLKLSNNPKASIEQIGKAIRRDQAIALKILRMANSAAYANGDPVESIDKAVIRIGLKEIGQAVMNISVVDQFNSIPAGCGIDPRLFWEHSIGCGIIAARIAGAVGCIEPDIAFTMGLIHDVGRFVYADMLGEQYEAVFRVAEEIQLPLEQVEKRLLGLNHADGMDRILHQWKFPRDLIDPIVFHHLSMGNIRRTAPRRRDEVATIALANRLAHALMLGSSGNESIHTTHEFCEALRIQPRIIHEIEAKVRDETDDLKFAMLSAGGADSWPDVRSTARERLGVQFRPVFVSAHPEFDALRIFCDQLAGCAEIPANIGIIHMTDSRERSQLSNAFRQAESQADTSNLPLVILSPSGKLKVDQSLLADHQHECLPTPFMIPRLFATLRRLIEASASAEAA